MGLQLITGPATLPVDIVLARDHLRIDGEEQDAAITQLIKVATAHAQQLTGRALITQRWRLVLDGFPRHALRLPLPPLQSVESITYLDVDGAEQTLDPAVYSVNPTGLVGQITPAYGQAWPATRAEAMAVAVEFTCGYTAVPDDIQAAMLLLIGSLDQYHEDVITGTIATQLPYGARVLLSPYVIPSQP
ncbi:head-tail connector protein [Pseudomonas paeninsulae]|uniref:head-tail connector protein n=1 Tax=Pseudomonas paeninsulae TaxID=3110772 RepID=UPI002D774C8D|nr:phage head-tail connector protein [Pseudomonas sp. IT1137]